MPFRAQGVIQDPAASQKLMVGDLVSLSGETGLANVKDEPP
jgi:hypothetical protein